MWYSLYQAYRNPEMLEYWIPDRYLQTTLVIFICKYIAINCLQIWPKLSAKIVSSWNSRLLHCGVSARLSRTMQANVCMSLRPNNPVELPFGHACLEVGACPGRRLYHRSKGQSINQSIFSFTDQCWYTNFTVFRIKIQK